MTAEYILVLTTVPDKETGATIASRLVEEKLAACVTHSAECLSVYWWEEKISRDSESMLFIKTKSALFGKLEARIKDLHPYEVPEIIGVPIVMGSKDYLDWIDRETNPRQ